MSEIKTDAPKIYSLMGEAMRRISAVGKDSVNQTQGFKYRGIDAVMNALYPVMSDLGLFIVPEVLEQTREERTTTKVYNGQEKKSTLLYSLLKIRYTMYAPDGSNVSAVVIGEGMDSGDKASNKAMAVGLKYACFQMFMIPTEEMANDDPDRVSHEVDPKAYANAPTGAGAAADIMEIEKRAQKAPKKDPPATVTQAEKLPGNPVLEYLAKERAALQTVREVTVTENKAIWTAQVKALKTARIAPDKELSEYTQAEAEALVAAMYKYFDPKGVEIKTK